MFKKSPYYVETKTCPHWIPITRECYACSRHKQREKHKFINCSVRPAPTTITQHDNMDIIFKVVVYQ